MPGLPAKRKILLISLAAVILFGLANLALLSYFFFFPEQDVGNLIERIFPGMVTTNSTQTGTPLVKPPVTTITLPKGKVLFQDDFSRVSNSWSRKENNVSLMDYVLDSYHILVKPPNYMVWSTIGKVFSDVIVEVDAQVSSEAGGDAGVICRYRSPENFYQMVVANDGYFGIYKIKNNEKNFLSMTQMRRNQAINPLKASNRLRAECVGSRLRFYANGSLLLEVFDLDFVTGDVGISAGSYNLGGVDVQFDNFVVMQP